KELRCGRGNEGKAEEMEEKCDSQSSEPCSTLKRVERNSLPLSEWMNLEKVTPSGQVSVELRICDWFPSTAMWNVATRNGRFRSLGMSLAIETGRIPLVLRNSLISSALVAVVNPLTSIDERHGRLERGGMMVSSCPEQEPL
ncbi:hypothetical protein SNEBB_008265, partial [Seison nebaliae]